MTQRLALLPGACMGRAHRSRVQGVTPCQLLMDPWTQCSVLLHRPVESANGTNFGLGRRQIAGIYSGRNRRNIARPSQ